MQSPDTCVYTGLRADQCLSEVISEFHSRMTQRVHVTNQCKHCGEMFFTVREPTPEEIRVIQNGETIAEAACR